MNYIINKTIEYVQNGYSITSNELNLIDSEKDRTKILSLYMLNDGKLDNRILSGISDEQNREEIILAWLKNQGEVRKKVKYNVVPNYNSSCIIFESMLKIRLVTFILFFIKIKAGGKKYGRTSN